jgi:hypothetical protein
MGLLLLRDSVSLVTRKRVRVAVRTSTAIFASISRSRGDLVQVANVGSAAGSID